MTRLFKNILMSFLLILSIGVIFYAYNEAHENVKVQFDIKSNIEDNFKEIKEKPNTDDGVNEFDPFKNDRIDKELLEKYRKEEITVDKQYVAIFAISSIVISIILVYFIMSLFNKKTIREALKNLDKITIFILSTLILSCALVYGEMYLTTGVEDKRMTDRDESQEKEVKSEDVEKGVVVNTKSIDLEDFDSNITITEAGEYTLKGNFKHVVLIDAGGEVTLNLNGVNIKNENTAAIANISENKLEINLIKGTENVLEDGGSSEYDACLYSSGELEIGGTGSLKVYGRQDDGEGIATLTKDIKFTGGDIYIESVDDGINAGGDGGLITIENGNIFIKASGDGIDSNKNLVINGGTIYTIGSSLGGDAGIDTDEGYTINGGTVVALGSDMLEAPLKNSKQNTLCFTLSSKIGADTLVTLVNEDDDAVISFKTNSDFRTLILSSPNLKEGTYKLYTDGNISGKNTLGIYLNGKYVKGDSITIGGKEEFSIKNGVSSYK